MYQFLQSVCALLYFAHLNDVNISNVKKLQILSSIHLSTYLATALT